MSSLKNNIIWIVGLIILGLPSCATKKQYDGFTTKDGRLIDSHGNDFVMRGVNLPNAWFPEKSFDALPDLAQNKVNCVRIVWETRLPAQDLDPILKKCIDLKMIPIVELHDVTGDSTATALYKMAEYFVSPNMQAIYKKYEEHLLINIANEWGPNELTAEYWRDSYIPCIDLLRAEGYKTAIVIDAPGWGQNSQPILQYAKALIAHDPLHNLLFSVHMYGSWNNDEKIKTDLQKAQQLSIPLIVGEFGYNHNNGNNNLGCKTNHTQILKTCSELNLGYLAWSWTGNNEANNWLDLVQPNDWKTLTTWGQEIFESPYGIKQTATKASVFTN